MYGGIIIIVILAILFFWSPWESPEKELIKAQEQEAEEEKRRQEQEEREERKRQQEKVRKEKFERDFPDAAYIEDSLNGKVVLYSAKNRLIQFCPDDKYHRSYTYKYDEILDVDVIDEANTSSVTTTSAGSMIGRTLVGAAVGGVAGAIVGGSTAKQSTATTVNHKYMVVAYTSRKYSPAEKITFDRDLDGANRTALVIKKILSL